MSFRIQRRMNMGSGLGLNLSKSGASPSIRTKFGSVGAKGFSLRTGVKGLYIRQSWGKGADGAIIGLAVMIFMFFINIAINLTFFLLKISLYLGWIVLAVLFNLIGWIVLTLYDLAYYLIFGRMNSDELGVNPKGGSMNLTMRNGAAIPTDSVFKAWAEGNLPEMLEAASEKTNLIDRHFLLLSIVEAAYKLRNFQEYRSICYEYAELHLKEFPKMIPKLKAQFQGNIPEVPTFKYFSTVLTEDGEYDKAISVCKSALDYGLTDGTKSGYSGRIERIIKKKNA